MAALLIVSAPFEFAQPGPKLVLDGDPER